MLRELRIKNFTIVDDLTILFEEGLNILTGETGAGKSVIVDAIGILLGDKASQDMIKTGAKEAHVEAFFDTADHPLLRELSIESDDGIILRRSIPSQGKGRAYINDTSVSIQTLSGIGKDLIDIHGQHEHQGLLRKESHVSFLDAFAGLDDDDGDGGQSLLIRYSSLYHETAGLKTRIAAMRERIRERGQRIEFLRFQLSEIDAAHLTRGEKESIEEERGILLNLSKLKENSETAYQLLYESESSSLSGLAIALARVREIAKIDHDAQECMTSLESALPVLEDTAIQIRKLRDKYDIDPKRLDELDERLELIKKLEKKYGDGVDEILAYRESADGELKGLQHIDEQLEELEAGLKHSESGLAALAEEISGRRLAAARKMETMILKELTELGFQKAEFRADMKKRDALTAAGIDDVEFLFSANPGEPLRPLAKVASGGELSRIMLALKCIEIGRKAGSRIQRQERKKAALRNGAVRTLIFDEVDAGIGGVTAQHVAKRLKDISGGYQVLCITHLPQIAALADHHMKVEKAATKEKVKVSIEPLTGPGREEELARMLSGRITDVSLKHARELLASAVNGKN